MFHTVPSSLLSHRHTDFRLYHSNSLDILAALLAAELRKPSLQTLLTPDIVIIPQAAVRRWLQTTLTSRCGILANVRFLTPSEFVTFALEANEARVEPSIDTPVLQWRLYAALCNHEVIGQPILQRFANYLADGDPLKPWSLATELNQAFETYATWRRDWLMQWEANDQAEDPQAFLWRVVTRGQRHRARRIQEYIKRFSPETNHSPQGLPSRLFVFATLNISPDVFRIITSQAQVGILHFYLPSPTAGYWGDLQRLLIRPSHRSNPPSLMDDDNPLLQAWGHAGRDFMAMLGSYEVIHPSGEIAAYADPEESISFQRAGQGKDRSLLKRIQTDIFHRRALPFPPPYQQLDLTDPSLQIHACHTRLRELQVVYNQLHALFNDARFTPELQLHDVAILAPDISLYEPYLPTVFRPTDQSGHLAYSLADNQAISTKPIAALFLRLLDLPVWRFGLRELFEILTSPPLDDLLGYDQQTLHHLEQWFYRAGVRWGLDSHHREALQTPPTSQFTWQYALDRLLLGYALDEPSYVARVAAFPGMDSSNQHAMNTVIRLLSILARYQSEFSHSLSALEWRERLLGLLDTLFIPQHRLDAASVDVLEYIRSHINTFAREAEQAEITTSLPLDVVKAYFYRCLNQTRSRSPLMTGGIQIGQMVPMRLIPFRVICLLGLNDSEFPRHDAMSELNRLTTNHDATSWRIGDRSLREEDRFLFLQLLNAAQDVFYLSYLGADPHDGSRREPSPIVSELIDVAAAYHCDSTTAKKKLIIHNPLHPYSIEAFGATDSRCVSFQLNWYQAGRIMAQERKTPSVWLKGPLTSAKPEQIAMATLTTSSIKQFLQHPIRFFLQKRLKLRLPSFYPSFDDKEPFLLAKKGKVRQQIEDTVCSLLCANANTRTIAERLTATGFIPTHLIGAQQLKDLIDKLEPFAKALMQWSGGKKPAAQIVNLSVGPYRLSGLIPKLYPQGMISIMTHPRTGSDVVSLGLDWLLAAAMENPVELVTFETDGQQTIRPQVLQPALQANQAQQLITALIGLLGLGLRRPLPYSAWSGWEYYSRLSEKTDKAVSAGRSCWIGNDHSWCEQKDPLTQKALLGNIPYINSMSTQLFESISVFIFDSLTKGHMEPSHLDELEYRYGYWH